MLEKLSKEQREEVEALLSTKDVEVKILGFDSGDDVFVSNTGKFYQVYPADTYRDEAVKYVLDMGGDFEYIANSYIGGGVALDAINSLGYKAYNADDIIVESNRYLKDNFEVVKEDGDFHKDGTLDEYIAEQYPYLVGKLEDAEVLFKEEVLFYGHTLKEVFANAKGQNGVKLNENLILEKMLDTVFQGQVEKIFMDYPDEQTETTQIHTDNLVVIRKDSDINFVTFLEETARKAQEQKAFASLYELQQQSSEKNGLKGDSPSVMVMLSYNLAQNLFYQGGRIDSKEPAVIRGLENEGIHTIYDIEARKETALMVKKDADGNFTLKTGNYNQDADRETINELIDYFSPEKEVNHPLLVEVGISADRFDDFRATKNICPEFLDMNDIYDAPMKLYNVGKEKMGTQYGEISSDRIVNINGVTIALEEGTMAYKDIKDENVAYVMLERTKFGGEDGELDVNIIQKIEVDPATKEVTKENYSDKESHQTNFTLTLPPEFKEVEKGGREDLSSQLDFSNLPEIKTTNKKSIDKDNNKPKPKPNQGGGNKG